MHESLDNSPAVVFLYMSMQQHTRAAAETLFLSPTPRLRAYLHAYTLPGQQQYSHAAPATYQGQQLVSVNDAWMWLFNDRAKAHGQTIFFTDRSLYRPGQTILYKGILIAVDQEADKYKAIGGCALTVVFRDVNGKEIARQPGRTNDYGSFSGSFTAPRDRLMGRMTIQVENRQQGGANHLG
jgi:hypothetical protein